MCATWKKSLSRRQKKWWTASEKAKATGISAPQITMSAAVDRTLSSNWSLRAAPRESQIAPIEASACPSWYVQKYTDEFQIRHALYIHTAASTIEFDWFGRFRKSSHRCGTKKRRCLHQQEPAHPGQRYLQTNKRRAVNIYTPNPNKITWIC